MIKPYLRIWMLSAVLLWTGVARAEEEEPTLPAVQPSAASPLVAGPTYADESVYVVQRRAYSKSGSFEITPLFFTSMNNKFVGHFGPGLSLAYHLRENLALEVMGSLHTWAFYSGLVTDVYQYESLTPEVVDLKQLARFGALSVQYSALYGKMEFYGWLIDYDFYATAGFGLAETRETCIPREESCGEDEMGIGKGLRPPAAASDRYKLAGSWGGGMRFFFSNWLGLRMEIRDIVYADKADDAGAVTTDIRNNVFFVLGLSLLL